MKKSVEQSQSCSNGLFLYLSLSVLTSFCSFASSIDTIQFSMRASGSSFFPSPWHPTSSIIFSSCLSRFDALVQLCLSFDIRGTLSLKGSPTRKKKKEFKQPALLIYCTMKNSPFPLNLDVFYPMRKALIIFFFYSHLIDRSLSEVPSSIWWPPFKTILYKWVPFKHIFLSMWNRLDQITNEVRSHRLYLPRTVKPVPNRTRLNAKMVSPLESGLFKYRYIHIRLTDIQVIFLYYYYFYKHFLSPWKLFFFPVEISDAHNSPPPGYFLEEKRKYNSITNVKLSEMND